MNAQTEVMDARSLVRWFWNHGVERKKYILGANWISQAYDVAELLEVAHAVEGRDRGGLAIWGPSQSGKSTLLSSFIDGDNESSALTWSAGHAFRFSRDDRRFQHVPALNPFNQGSDASGCVTCFTACESVPDPDHPVRITLASRQGLMQSLAAGYLMECVLTTPERDITTWTRDSIMERLLSGSRVGTRLDKQALELARDLSVTVERLISDREPRYQSLARQEAWGRELRGVLMSSATNAEEMLNIVREMLWDNAPGLNRLFAQLDAQRATYETVFAGQPVYCSLEFAALLLDIDTYGALAAMNQVDETDAPEAAAAAEAARLRQQALLSRVLDFTYERRDDAFVIGQGRPAKDRLYRDADGFGLLQGLVWAIEVPLNARVIRASSETLANLLQRTDLYDIPGVAREEKGRSEQQLSAQEDASTAALLTKVVKRGKTASIITQFARERRIDGILLLLKGGDFPAKPKQLISGVEAIWRGLNRAWHRQMIPPPAPTFLCLTFMARFVNEAAQAGLGQHGLDTLGSMLKNLGELADPRVVATFTTTYPQYDQGEIRISEAERQALFNQITRDRWFREQFHDETAVGSFHAMMFKVDGGVEFLLQAMSERMGAPASRDFVREVVRTEGEKLDQLIAEALPVRDGVLDETRMALDALARGIKSMIGVVPEDRSFVPDYDDGYVASAVVRGLMDVDPEQLQPLPRGKTNARDLEFYLEAQVRNWQESHAAGTALSQAGVNPRHVSLVLDAFADTIDVRTLARSLFPLLPDQATQRQAEHFRTYVAASMSNDLLGRDTFAARQNAIPVDTPNFMTAAQQRFDDWADGTDTVSSPHYDMIVRPFLSRIDDVANQVQARSWEPQSGDEQIEALARRRPALTRNDAGG
jgi:Putative bacterial virulence factor